MKKTRNPKSPQKSALGTLRTEQSNRASSRLDLESTLNLVRIINREDGKVARAVQVCLPQIAKAVDRIAEQLRRGGRLIYVGAGTSGRIAALDASECPPTFGTHPSRVQFIMAGGVAALSSAVEANEDSREDGERDMAKRKPGRKDIIVGVAASGRTPYTVAAVQYARRAGADTIAVCCNAGSPLEKAAQIAIVPIVGPEVLSGSSRMKAGTAQKMVLNMLTTGAMTRLGYVYGNLMVNVHPTNQKLVDRATRILQTIAEIDEETAREALKNADMSVPVALVMLKTELSARRARLRLKAQGGNVRRAIAASPV
jgi:N-acetylmuramic acid 6-phosphate etherase